MTGATLSFWLIVILTVGSAFFVVQSQNLLYSAVSLLFTFMGVAGLYIFLMADFIAASQVVVYVGGILVLLVFGIMLTHRITHANISHPSMLRRTGGFISFLMFLLLLRVVFTSPWFIQDPPPFEGTTSGIGKLLMIDYLLPFEVASVLLLTALVGASMLSRPVFRVERKNHS